MKRVGMLGVAVVVLACERETPRGDGTPVLVPIDSVVLTENDSVTLGLPNSLAMLPSGDFFVGDAAQPKVVRYGRDGKPRGTVGRRGSEPGEFRFPSRLTAVGDTTLLVGNASALQVLAFDTRSGKPRWVRRVPAQVSSMSAADNRLYIGFVGHSNTGSIGVLDLPTSNEPTTANLPVPVTAIGPMPDLFTRAPTAATIFGTVELTAFGETIASAYEVSNHV